MGLNIYIIVNIIMSYNSHSKKKKRISWAFHFQESEAPNTFPLKALMKLHLLYIHCYFDENFRKEQKVAIKFN